MVAFDVDKLRSAYLSFLELKYPDLTYRSRKTKADDVFCLFHWTTEEEAWKIIQSRGEELDLQRNFIADEFLSQRKNAYKDAGGYLRAIREFQSFLDLCYLIDDARLRKPRVVGE